MGKKSKSKTGTGPQQQQPAAQPTAKVEAQNVQNVEAPLVGASVSNVVVPVKTEVVSADVTVAADVKDKTEVGGVKQEQPTNESNTMKKKKNKQNKQNNASNQPKESVEATSVETSANVSALGEGTDTLKKKRNRNNKKKNAAPAGEHADGNDGSVNETVGISEVVKAPNVPGDGTLKKNKNKNKNKNKKTDENAGEKVPVEASSADSEQDVKKTEAKISENKPAKNNKKNKNKGKSPGDDKKEEDKTDIVVKKEEVKLENVNKEEEKKDVLKPEKSPKPNKKQNQKEKVADKTEEGQKVVEKLIEKSAPEDKKKEEEAKPVQDNKSNKNNKNNKNKDKPSTPPAVQKEKPVVKEKIPEQVSKKEEKTEQIEKKEEVKPEQQPQAKPQDSKVEEKPKLAPIIIPQDTAMKQALTPVKTPEKIPPLAEVKAAVKTEIVTPTPTAEAKIIIEPKPEVKLPSPAVVNKKPELVKDEKNEPTGHDKKEDHHKKYDQKNNQQKQGQKQQQKPQSPKQERQEPKLEKPPVLAPVKEKVDDKPESPKIDKQEPKLAEVPTEVKPQTTITQPKLPEIAKQKEEVKPIAVPHKIAEVVSDPKKELPKPEQVPKTPEIAPNTKKESPKVDHCPKNVEQAQQAVVKNNEALAEAKLVAPKVDQCPLKPESPKPATAPKTPEIAEQSKKDIGAPPTPAKKQEVPKSVSPTKETEKQLLSAVLSELIDAATKDLPQETASLIKPKVEEKPAEIKSPSPPKIQPKPEEKTNEAVSAPILPPKNAMDMSVITKSMVENIPDDRKSTSSKNVGGSDFVPSADNGAKSLGNKAQILNQDPLDQLVFKIIDESNQLTSKPSNEAMVRETQNITPTTNKRNKDQANLKQVEVGLETKNNEVPEKNAQEKLEGVQFTPIKLLDILDAVMVASPEQKQALKNASQKLHPTPKSPTDNFQDDKQLADFLMKSAESMVDAIKKEGGDPIAVLQQKILETINKTDDRSNPSVTKVDMGNNKKGKVEPTNKKDSPAQRERTVSGGKPPKERTISGGKPENAGQKERTISGGKPEVPPKRERTVSGGKKEGKTESSPQKERTTSGSQQDTQPKRERTISGGKPPQKERTISGGKPEIPPKPENLNRNPKRKLPPNQPQSNKPPQADIPKSSETPKSPEKQQTPTGKKPDIPPKPNVPPKNVGPKTPTSPKPEAASKNLQAVPIRPLPEQSESSKTSDWNCPQSNAKNTKQQTQETIPKNLDAVPIQQTSENTGNGNNENPNWNCQQNKNINSKNVMAVPIQNNESNEQQSMNWNCPNSASSSSQIKLDELNKAENICQTQTKNVKQVIPAPTLPSKKPNLLLDDDDDEEYIEYKFIPRQVFLATICHVCQIPLSQYIVCNNCLMISYCSESHMEEDAVTHRSMCLAVREIAKKRGGHIYNNSKILGDEEFRTLRVHAMNLCQASLGRALQPYEREILLFPRMCATTSCREWRNDLLTDCKECGQVAYCLAHSDHLPVSHSKWCKYFSLYQKMVIRQKKNGRIDPKLPTKILQKPYLVQRSMENVFRDLYKNCSGLKDDCVYATLTQLATAPLTALFGSQKCNQTIGEEFTIHLVGAELQFEADTLDKWEAFFLHLVPQLNELKIVFIGPELNSENLPLDILSRIRMCHSCRQSCRAVKFDFQCDMLYHNYCKTSSFTKPDLVCFFNPGLHRSTGFKELDTWPETINMATSFNCPVIVTSYTEIESPLDFARLEKESKRPLNIIQSSDVNPFTSYRPERNFISAEVAPMIFKNYYYFIVN